MDDEKKSPAPKANTPPPQQSNEEKKAEEERTYKKNQQGVEKEIGSELDALKSTAGKISIQEAVQQIGITDLKGGNKAQIATPRKSYKSSLKQVRTFQKDIEQLQQANPNAVPPDLATQSAPAPTTAATEAAIPASQNPPPQLVVPEAPKVPKKRTPYQPYTTTLGGGSLPKEISRHAAENTTANTNTTTTSGAPQEQNVQGLNASSIQSLLTGFLSESDEKKESATTSTPQTPTRQTRTFDDDLAQTIRTENKSIIDVAIDSQKNRNLPVGLTPPQAAKNRSIMIPAIIISSVLVVAGISAVFFSSRWYNKQTVETHAVTTGAIIRADKEKEVLARAVPQASFSNLIAQTAVPDGSMMHFYITDGTGEAGERRNLVPSSEFLSFFDTSIEPYFMRTLENQFMFGVHKLKKNEPFLILKTTSYDHAFAGMLAWEREIRSDLTPLFGGVADTLVQKTEETVDENGATTTRSFLDPVKPNTRVFEDLVVRNRDTRVIRDQNGTIIFLYSFPNRDTLIITSNNATFVEILSRMASGAIPQ